MSIEILSNGTSGDTSDVFSFRANVTGGESPYSFYWTLDDRSEKRNRTFMHSFSEPGTYNLTLTVTDNAGVEVSDSIEIEIEEAQDDAKRVKEGSFDSGESSMNMTDSDEQE